MATPPGKKADQAGIWQSAICLRVLAALSAAAPLPRGQAPQRMPEGGEVGVEWDREGGHEKEIIAVENIYAFFRMECLRMPLAFASFQYLAGSPVS